MVNRQKLILLSAVSWGAIVLLPIGSAVINEIDNFLTTLFVLLLLYYPVWLSLGWRWVTDFRSTPPFWLWLLLCFSGLLLSSFLLEERMEELFAFAPIIANIMFLYFLFLVEPEFFKLTKKNTQALWAKPPIWLVLLCLVPIYVIIHMTTSILTPLGNIAALIAFGICWGIFKIFVKSSGKA